MKYSRTWAEAPCDNSLLLSLLSFLLVWHIYCKDSGTEERGIYYFMFGTIASKEALVFPVAKWRERDKSTQMVLAPGQQ